MNDSPMKYKNCGKVTTGKYIHSLTGKENADRFNVICFFERDNILVIK